MLRLWQREDCRQSILEACGGPKFQAFLGAIYDTLLYQLNDGLSRLVNVRQQEVAKDSESRLLLSLLLLFSRFRMENLSQLKDQLITFLSTTICV